MTRRIVILFACAIAIITASCSDEELAAPAPVPAQDKDVVLAELARSWNEGDIGAYAALVAKEFVGYFGPAEEADGCRSAMWDRAHEVAAARAIFKENGTEGGSIQDLKVTLSFDKGGWGEVQPPVPANGEATRFFTKTIGYRLTARLSNSFILSSSKAVVDLMIGAVDGGDGSTVWKIVAFSDRVEGDTRSAQGDAWSRLKCLYR